MRISGWDRPPRRPPPRDWDDVAWFCGVADGGWGAMTAARSIRGFGRCLAVAGAMQAMYDAGYEYGWDDARYCEGRWEPNVEGRAIR